MNNKGLPTWLNSLRVPILIGLHVFVFTFAFITAYLLRFDFAIPAEHQSRLFQSIGPVVAIQVFAFWYFGTLHGWWRYVTFRDLVSFIKPLAVSFFIVLAVNYVIPTPIPRSVLIVHWLLSGLILSGVRSGWRLSQEGFMPTRPKRELGRAFMISNHHDTIVLANQINSQHNSSTEIVGLLTFEKYHRGAERAGIPIVGNPGDAAKLAAEHDVEQIWLVAGSIPGPELSELKKSYDAHGLQTKVIPSAVDRNLTANFIPVREIDINDLLRREPVHLDADQISNELTGKVILVTGAGGSIGSEICRQLLTFNPRQVILVDHRENSVFMIHNELLRTDGLSTDLVPAVGDILDKQRMSFLFSHYQPEFVYHAAAHKHVGLMEANPGEAVKTNILGTQQVADLADQESVTKFVMVSTDKAVNPTSVMGCTKQIAERYIMTLNSRSKTQFVAVRFGNVLGSSGSVVPIFKEQIARGGPITITDERMTRYFMTIPEASQLVLQAASMGSGGEIFVLDMGEPVKIVDLANTMIELAGLPPSAIEIEFSGARPGEKMYEELYFSEEHAVPTVHAKILAANHRKLDFDDVKNSIEALAQLTSWKNNDGLIRERLRKIVPEFDSNPSPIESRDSDPCSEGSDTQPA